MKIKNRIILFCFTTLGLTNFSYGQDMLIIDGGSITTDSTSIITVQGNLVNTNTGTIDNSGIIYVSGDWENDAGNTTLINNSKGWVELNGNNQDVKGSDITDFYNLRLSGSGTSTKTLRINTNINNHLALANNQFQTLANILFVNNPITNSISWNGGYVSSSDLGGYLVRSTQSDSTYIYPVGNNNLLGTYRAVKLAPNSSNPNSYGVRLAAINPGIDNSGTSASGAVGPFSENSLGNNVDAINTTYYHNINRFSGTDSCDIMIDYFTSDGLFTSVAQWNGNSFEWENRNYNSSTSTSSSLLNSPDLTMNKLNVGNFNHDVFAFEKLDKDIVFPGGVSPNGDGQNDVLFIENLSFFPENELMIFNRWGDLIFKASPYLNDWSGKSEEGFILTGDEVVDGTYFYVLKLNEKIQPLSGSFELKRK